MPVHTEAERAKHKKRFGKFVKKVKGTVERAFNIGEEKDHPPHKKGAQLRHSAALAETVAKKGELTEADIEKVTTPKKKKKKK